MTRDFTEAEKEKLLEYVKQDKDKNDNRGWWGGIVDLGADVINYGGLDIADYSDKIDVYHMKLVDKEDYTSEDIEDLFEAVGEVDSDYSESFVSSNSLLEEYKNTLIELQNIMSVDRDNPEKNTIFMDSAVFYQALCGVGNGLIDYYYNQYFTTNEDGETEIDWDAVTEFFERDPEDIDAMEYAAMMKLTDAFVVEQEGEYSIDTDNMKRFIECAYSYDCNEMYWEGDTNVTNKAILSPAYIQLSQYMKARTTALVNGFGDHLFDENVGDEIEQFVEADAMKTSMIDACVTNFSQVNVDSISQCNHDGIGVDSHEPERNLIREWKIDISISEKDDYYLISIDDGIVGEATNPGGFETKVYGFTNTFNSVGHDCIEEISTSLYVDLDEKFSGDLEKEVVKKSLDSFMGKIIEGCPGLGLVYDTCSFMVDEAEALSEAQAQNEASEALMVSEDIRYYSDALSIGGCANTSGSQMQVVIQYCNEGELNEKIDFYNENKNADVTKEQLISDYNSMLQGEEVSDLLDDFARYINDEYH